MLVLRGTGKEGRLGYNVSMLGILAKVQPTGHRMVVGEAGGQNSGNINHHLHQMTLEALNGK